MYKLPTRITQTQTTTFCLYIFYFNLLLTFLFIYILSQLFCYTILFLTLHHSLYYYYLDYYIYNYITYTIYIPPRYNYTGVERICRLISLLYNKFRNFPVNFHKKNKRDIMMFICIFIFFLSQAQSLVSRYRFEFSKVFFVNIFLYFYIYNFINKTIVEYMFVP